MKRRFWAKRVLKLADLVFPPVLVHLLKPMKKPLREDVIILPGIVSFTATRWGQLLKSKKMPEGEAVPQAVDCYRYVLSNPYVDICMMGAKNIKQMRENLTTLDKGPMSEQEIRRMNKIGEYLYKR